MMSKFLLGSESSEETVKRVEKLHAVLKALPHYHSSMKHLQWFPARTAQFGEVDSSIRACLPPGIDQLYTHQIQVLVAAQSSQAVALATPVASGKTYALALPARVAHARHERTTVLCIVSTKALARQWQRRLQSWDQTWQIAIYTGDSKEVGTKSSLSRADVVIVTPEKLHHGILPHHHLWQEFLQSLHSVILDDCQEYRGVFGSHVALVLRRLQRVILLYRITLPTFLLGSALIGNPKEHAEQLLGLQVDVIDAGQDGSASGGSLHILWQPSKSQGQPLVNETALLLAKMMLEGYRVVVFAQARQTVDKIVHRARMQLPEQLRGQIRSYRGGYDLDERVETEEELVSEHLQAVVTTRALEVGLEMGAVDVVIIVGFPGSLISYFQQAGRAGRQLQSAICIFIPRPDALDESFMAHPERLWEGTTEPLWLNAHSRSLLVPHLRCAAAEVPLTSEDQNLFGPQMVPVIESLVKARHLIQQGDRYSTSLNIAAQVPLRSWGTEVVIQLEEKVIERMDRYHAVIECYPQAVYYSHGIPYQVTSFKQAEDLVIVEKSTVTYDTKPVLTTQVVIMQELQVIEDGPFQWIRGWVQVKHFVTGFDRQAREGRKSLGGGHFQPPYSFAFETNALWMNFSDQVIRTIQRDRVHPALHAVEHGWLALCPLLVQGDRSEMNGVTITPHHPQTQQASIFLYEDCERGNGYGERIYLRFQELITNTFQLLEACPCQDGCYRCIWKPYCRYFNASLEKQGAIKLLRKLARQFHF